MFTNICINIVSNTLQLKQQATDDIACVLVLPPYQGCGYDKFFTGLCKH